MALPEIFPTELDIGGAGLGRVFTEANWTKLFGQQNSALHAGVNYVVDGLDEASINGLDVTYNGGTAVINGYVVELAGDTVTLQTNARNYVYVVLTRDVNQNVDGATFDVDTSQTPPPDSALIADVLVTVGGVVDPFQNRDARNKSPNGAWGSYNGDDSGSAGSPRLILTGFTPSFIIVMNNTDAPLVFGLAGRGFNGSIGAQHAGSVSITTTTSPATALFGFTVFGSAAGSLNNNTWNYKYVALR